MHCFTDTQNRTWSLIVNVATIKRVRALCDIDLSSIISLDPNGKANVDVLEKIANDPVLLVDVIYALVKPEADSKGITDEEFGTSMAGDCIETATEALLEEIVDFFPEAKRKILRKIVETTKRFNLQARTTLETILTNPDLDNQITQELKRLSTLPPNSVES